MRSIRQFYSAVLICFLGLASSCTAPRSVIHSGKVTPKGEFKVGFDYVGNVASQPIDALADVTKDLVNSQKNQDSIFVSDPVFNLSKAALAYSLDPAIPSFDVYVRYGLAKRVDVGYKYAFGTHVFDGMYQFMGSTGSVRNPGAEGMYGSIGFQVSRQKSELPGKFLLDDIADLLQYKATRTDILIPLVFSNSFGPEEEFGNISYGISYSRSFINYSFNPNNVFEQKANMQDVVPVEKISEKKSYGALGFFVNAKFGFRYAYVLPALAVYYQNYGTYKLLAGRQAELKGFTFIPSLGVQFQFGKGR
jgi:hypothetical protein